MSGDNSLSSILTKLHLALKFMKINFITIIWFKECGSVGPHFNPQNTVHGDINDSIRHVGDYGNSLMAFVSLVRNDGYYF